MLIGEYTHSIDDKNRVSIPSKFRVDLGKKVVITPGLDTCLFVFTAQEWKRIAKSLASSSLLQSDSRSFHRFMFGGAHESNLDSIGRISIPEHLRNYGMIKRSVTVIGVNSRVEIWDQEIWAKYKKSVHKDVDSLADRLGNIGVL